MAKNAKSGKPEVKVVRGLRRHNRSNGHGTVNQNVAQSQPKWENIGNGVLKLRPFKGTRFGTMRRHDNEVAYIRLAGRKHASITRKMVDILTAPAQAPDIDLEQAAE